MRLISVNSKLGSNSLKTNCYQPYNYYFESSINNYFKDKLRRLSNIFSERKICFKSFLRSGK